MSSLSWWCITIRELWLPHHCPCHCASCLLLTRHGYVFPNLETNFSNSDECLLSLLLSLLLYIPTLIISCWLPFTDGPHTSFLLCLWFSNQFASLQMCWFFSFRKILLFFPLLNNFCLLPLKLNATEMEYHDGRRFLLFISCFSVLILGTPSQLQCRGPWAALMPWGWEPIVSSFGSIRLSAPIQQLHFTAQTRL